MEQEKFYQEKTWELLFIQLEEIKAEQYKQAAILASIQKKLNWVYGWAAGIALIVGLAWQYIKTIKFKIQGLL